MFHDQNYPFPGEKRRQTIDHLPLHGLKRRFERRFARLCRARKSPTGRDRALLEDQHALGALERREPEFLVSALDNSGARPDLKHSVLWRQ